MKQRKPGTVVAVSSSPSHLFSKDVVTSIKLVAGLGVEGDAHYGKTAQHLHRIAQDPTQPNLRQVHLIHGELFDELATQGFNVGPGQMGENITTRGVDLLALPTDTELHIGNDVILLLTGLRNPCSQIDKFQSGLLAAVVDKTAKGMVTIKSGVMGIVLAGGVVRAGDEVRIQLPAEPHRALEKI